jgi:hypothetical protein
MSLRKEMWVIFCVAVLGLAGWIPQSHAATKCQLDFTLKSWSVFYKSGKGSGTITCDNGQKAAVRIRAQGGGITFGKSTIRGNGEFSPVESIQKLYGSYGEAEGHAGVVKSASGHTLSKDDITMNLTGSGGGVDIGFDFGSFKILRK